MTDAVVVQPLDIPHVFLYHSRKYGGNITKRENTVPRVEAQVFANNPNSKYGLRDNIDSEKFPIYLTLDLSQQHESTVEKIKMLLKNIPKEEVRFRTQKNLYCNSIEFRAYFTTPKKLRNFVDEHFGDTFLVKSSVSDKDVPQSYISLHKEAISAIATQKGRA